MGQKKHKSIHDNISLEGLETVFELQPTDPESCAKTVIDRAPNQISELESDQILNSDLQSTEKSIFDEITDSLKLKANRKAIGSFLDSLGSRLRANDCTVFSHETTRKSKENKKKKQTALKEIVHLVVVQAEASEQILYLENSEKTRLEQTDCFDRSDSIVEVIPENSKKKSFDNTAVTALEDELHAACCKIDVLKNKELSLKNRLADMENELAKKDEELTWVKSQQDMLSSRLHLLESSWWSRLKNFWLG
ncbi:MAG TPA: hypothetical protein PKD05_03215 [Candidatus Melainabacteria bacterium]|nr:hypothetical protein [Candidatus Melainabacteria bacterium]HMP50539.1 hypothetical protein [Candidatus Melainabacteria bacterium]